MMTGRVTVAIMLAAVSASAMARPPQAPVPQRPTFRASTDVVTVDVSVRDRARVITGLAADDFLVLDNGVPQRVTDVSYGKLPIDVTVALDVSFSVIGARLDQLRRAIRELMRDLTGNDRLKLITFNMRVTRVVDFTTEAEAVENAIGAATAGGGSSIWDAAAVALVSASTPERRQLVIMFTDAADSSSTTQPDALLDLAGRTNATVASVLPGSYVTAPSIAPGRVGSTVVFRPAAAEGAAVLRRLATQTGGAVLTVSTTGSLSAAFRQVLEEFRASYVLHYVPQGVERDGFHVLQVSVKGRSGATIRARRGYYWQ